MRICPTLGSEAREPRASRLRVSTGVRAALGEPGESDTRKRRVHGRRVYYRVTVTHVYLRGGHRTVNASVTDRAGNATTVTRKL